MRLALLGIDDTTLAIAAAVCHAGTSRIVMVDAAARRAQEGMKLVPQAKLLANWEDVLSADAVDAVIVAADDPALRIEQLRRLIQLEIPTLVSHPVCLSMLDAYELDMIHAETRGVLMPWLPTRFHPAIAEMWDTVEAGESSAIGQVEQITLERFLPNRDRESVLRQFACDADVLQYLAGDAFKLHAMGSTFGQSAASTYGNLNIQINCGDGLVCRWSVAPVEERPLGRLTLVGSKGKLVLQIPADQREVWQCETRMSGRASKRDFAPWDSATLAIESLAAAMGGEMYEPTWTEAARTIELADTVDRSLARGRTIDLHQEEYSDISTFKGTMASIGCGLLMLGLMLIVVVAIAHSIAVNAGWGKAAGILGNWPYLLLAVLGVFLICQLLLLVGKKAASTPQMAIDRENRSPTGDEQEFLN